VIHCCNRGPNPSTSSWLNSQRKDESDGDLAICEPRSVEGLAMTLGKNALYPAVSPDRRGWRGSPPAAFTTAGSAPTAHEAIRQRFEEAEKVSSCSRALNGLRRRGSDARFLQENSVRAKPGALQGQTFN
jgi:hypothetical protein